MKTFPIPSQPPRDDRDRPGSPSAADDSNMYASNASNGYAKGGMVKTAHYAEGGPVYGRVRSFVKEPNEFTPAMPPKNPNGVPQAYVKSGKGTKPPDKTPNKGTPVPRT